MMAVTSQPQSESLSVPFEIERGSSGLEYFASVNQIMVKKNCGVLEDSRYLETKIDWLVYDEAKQLLFKCYHELSSLYDICCTSNKEVKFYVEDNHQKKVITIQHEFRCCTGCPCHTQTHTVLDGQAKEIGKTQMMCFCCLPEFGIFDNSGSQIYRVSGRCCRCHDPCCCKDDVNFPVSRVTDGVQIANIAKQMSGGLQNLPERLYHVTFPMDMPAADKAVIFASVFQVDLLYQGQHN